MPLQVRENLKKVDFHSTKQHQKKLNKIKTGKKLSKTVNKY